MTDAIACPKNLRHIEQWHHASRNGAAFIRNDTAPQRHEPVCTATVKGHSPATADNNGNNNGEAVRRHLCRRRRRSKVILPRRRAITETITARQFVTVAVAFIVNIDSHRSFYL
ncbi:MAG: hypothetical protein MPK08_06050 [Alphaproteobacteria bacterium]|nr:hypothetical protein [Alphaproteobacteria bacterium]